MSHVIRGVVVERRLWDADLCGESPLILSFLKSLCAADSVSWIFRCSEYFLLGQPVVLRVWDSLVSGII